MALQAATYAPDASGARRLVLAALAMPGAVYLLVGLTLVLTFATGGFLTAANLTNVALQASALTIVALGMTLVILTEGIDLSLGPLLGLAGVVMGMLAVAGWPIGFALAAAILVGVAFGSFNGVFIARYGMPPFIVTLGTFGIAQSIAMVLTEGNSITNLPPIVRWFNDGVFVGVPVPIWSTALIFAATYALLHHTRFGRYVFAIGGNRQALVLAGVRVRTYQVGVYAYAGLLTALASFITTARMNAAHPTIGVGLEFDAIAAVILGGTSFEKGRGGIVGTVLGALAVAVLRNGLNLLGVSTEWQVACVGVVIIAAVALDSLRGINA